MSIHKQTIKKSIVALAIIAAVTTSANAATKIMHVGYSNINMNDTTTSGLVVGYGIEMGEEYKHTFGAMFNFISSNDDDTSEDSENIGNIYYSLGHKVLTNTIAYASIGYGFQSLGTVGSGETETTAMAAGTTFGLGVKYDITKSIAADLSFYDYGLEYEGLDYGVTTTNLNLIYKF